MENLIIKNGCINLVDECGNMQIVMTLGFAVGSLFLLAKHHKLRGRLEQADEYRKRASRVMNTPEYKEWLLGPATIDD